MRSSLKLALAAVSALLGGCAVYGPPPAYGEGPYYQQVAPVYAQPGYGYYGQPVYVQPAPVYAAPPVSFGFNFGWWGGGGHRGRR